MAKIDFYVPEPSEVYNKDTQRQIIQNIFAKKRSTADCRKDIGC